MGMEWLDSCLKLQILSVIVNMLFLKNFICLQSRGLVVMISRSQSMIGSAHSSEKVPCSTHGATKRKILLLFHWSFFLGGVGNGLEKDVRACDSDIGAS